MQLNIASYVSTQSSFQMCIPSLPLVSSSFQNKQVTKTFIWNPLIIYFIKVLEKSKEIIFCIDSESGNLDCDCVPFNYFDT